MDWEATSSDSYRAVTVCVFVSVSVADFVVSSVADDVAVAAFVAYVAMAWYHWKAGAAEMRSDFSVLQGGIPTAVVR